MDLTSGSDAATVLTTETKKGHLGLIISIVVVVLAAIGVTVWIMMPPAKTTIYDQSNATAAGFTVPVIHKLDPIYTDADSDLLADAPTDPSKLIDPAKLVFCFVAADDAESYKKKWKGFCDYLSQATGKPVEYLLVTTAHDEAIAMRSGKLQVAAFNTGSVPLAVNTAGFIPVCALPSGDNGALTHTDIIVPIDSTLQKPEDLRGRELTLTAPDSNSGCKAPLVLLRSNFGMQGVEDFNLRYSFSHEASIEGIVSHKYEAAAVASDMLGREIAAGVITPGQFRTIYESESFPTAAFGYAYNLKPELAKKIRDALASFDWAGTPLEKDLSSSRQTKFVPINYKNDWSLIRRIDDEMGTPEQR